MSGDPEEMERLSMTANWTIHIDLSTPDMVTYEEVMRRITDQITLIDLKVEEIKVSRCDY